MLRPILFAAIVAAPITVIAADKPKVLAVVNGAEINQASFELYGERRLGSRPDGELPDEKRKELIEELVHRELIFQDAKSMNLEKDEDYQRELQEVIRNIAVRYRVDRLLEESPPSEDLMKQIYQEQIVGQASMEYRARQVLMQSESEAKAVIDDLNKGKDFVEVAKKHSSGPSAEDGGDLGWFTLNQMVKPFADAVEKLKVGGYTTRPVQSRFGWHVIKLEETRKVEPPSFSSVHEQIMQIAQNKIIGEYLEKLKQNAKIEIK